MRKAQRWLAQIGPAGGFDAFDGAAERRSLQIQGKDFPLGEMRLQLQGAQQLAQLSPHLPRTSLLQGRVEDAGHLHGHGRPPGNDPAPPQPLQTRAPQGDRIHPRVPPVPAVLIPQQGLQIQRRHRLYRRRIPPYPLGVGKCPQRTAVARHHHAARIAPIGQRQRISSVQHQQCRQQYRRAPTQDAPDPARPCPAPGAPFGLTQGCTTVTRAGTALPTPRSSG